MKNKLTLKTIDQDQAMTSELESAQGGIVRCIGLYDRNGRLVEVYCNDGSGYLVK